MSLIVLLKIFLRPLVYWLIALSAYLYLRYFVADSFSDSAYLVGLAETVRTKAAWVALIPFAVGALFLAQRLQLLYCWSSDANQGCDFCGMLLDEKTGRYGPYRKCLNCGETKSGWS